MGQILGRYGGAQHDYASLVDDGNRRHGNHAGHWADNALNLLVNQALHGSFRLLGVLLIVFNQQFNGAPINAPRPVTHFYRQQRAVAARNAKIGHAARNAAQKSNFYWFFWRTAKERTSQGQYQQ